MNVALPDILLSLFCAFFAFLVVISKNPIVSAFSLLVTFLGFAGIYFQLGSVFLTAVQILVYAGAIAILFIFVLMLMNLSEPVVQGPQKNYGIILGMVCLLIFFGVLAIMIFQNADYLSSDKLPAVSMNLLFAQLFEKYLVPFELATILLLGAIVAAVFVSKKGGLVEEAKK